MTNETLINDMSVVGLMLGCLLCGKFMFIGRKNAIILSNVVSAVGCVLCLFLNVWLITLGKLVFGFGCGLAIVSCSIWNRETLPPKVLSYMGTSVNFGIILGLLVSTTVQNLCLGHLTDEQLKTTTAWRWPLAFVPLTINLISVLLVLCYLRQDSIDFCLEKNKTEEAKKLAKRVYVFNRPEDCEHAL